METPHKKRVLVVDGIALTRFAMRSILDLHPLVEVVDEAKDAPEARRLCAEIKPDLVVLDLRLPRGDGLDLLRDLRNLHSPVKLLVCSEEEDLTMVRRAFRAGAGGYVSKCDESHEIPRAIEQVLSGRRFASRRVSEGLLDVLAGGMPEKRAREVETLSNRELHIFRLLGRNVGATAIARELGITVKTVETHQLRLKQKLNVRSCDELRKRAEAWASEGGPAPISEGRATKKRGQLTPPRKLRNAALT